jgi:hypothetical protein
VKIAAGEGPLDQRGGPFIVALESEEALFEFSQRREIVGCENLPLNDGEIDLDWVEPTGMDRGVDEDGIGPLNSLSRSRECPP